MTVYIILFFAWLFIMGAMYIMNNQEFIVLKAQEKKNMFNFYHILALMTSPNYKGYISTDEEKKAMEDYLSDTSEYDKHPIGGYFNIRKQVDSMLKCAGSMGSPVPKFVNSELGIGFSVMLLFIGIVVLGVMFC